MEPSFQSVFNFVNLFDSVRVHHACGLQIFLLADAEIIGVDEFVVAGIIRRVYVYHFYFTAIGVLQHPQCVQIVALNKNIPRGVKILALFAVGDQRFIHGRGGLRFCLAFAGELQFIAIGLVGDIHMLALQPRDEVIAHRQFYLVGFAGARFGYRIGECGF